MNLPKLCCLPVLADDSAIVSSSVPRPQVSGAYLSSSPWCTGVEALTLVPRAQHLCQDVQPQALRHQGLEHDLWRARYSLLPSSCVLRHRSMSTFDVSAASSVSTEQKSTKACLAVAKFYGILKSNIKNDQLWCLCFLAAQLYQLLLKQPEQRLKIKRKKDAVNLLGSTLVADFARSLEPVVVFVSVF